MEIKSIHFCNYRCFQDENRMAGFDTIKPINIIIGKNNSGKSHLLALVEFLCDINSKNKPCKITSDQVEKCIFRFSSTLDDEFLRSIFREDIGGGLIPGNHWQTHGIPLLGKEIFIKTERNNRVLKNFNATEGINLDQYNQFKINKIIQFRIDKINDGIQSAKLTYPLVNKIFRKLSAERDILIEQDSRSSQLSPNGDGATNIIRKFLHSSESKYSRKIITDDLRLALNEIFSPDIEFSEIYIKRHEGQTDEKANEYEIFLGEKDKDLIPLSHSGSGIKTVLLVLINLLVIPEIEQKPPSDYTYVFEELENNLHPSLLRRLLIYIEKFALKQHISVFITTHSPIPLDMFTNKDHAQIIRVINDGKSSYTETVSDDFSRIKVIESLGSKPSDILQANGVIWVEGPSDRIIINKWIELASNGELQEGRHYQCAFYGGALLSQQQITYQDQQDQAFANLFNINHNVAVICDSDKTSQRSHLKPRVIKIREELAKIEGGFLWIFDAREIENYYPAAALSQIDKFQSIKSIADVGQYEPFFPKKRDREISYSERVLMDANLNQEKVELALSIAQVLTKEMMQGRFDWQTQINKLVDTIRRWNS